MALARTGGQGLDQQHGEGIGHGRSGMESMKGEHTAPVHHCHTSHTPSGTKGEESTGETQHRE